MTLAPGTVVGGDFLIESLLARGGMGAVYVAMQLSTHKRRALKLMLDLSLDDPDLRRRFEQEAKVAALVESEHVVGVVGAGVDPALGFPWLAMELLEGESLEALAERRGPLPPSEVAALLEQLCHALGAAHAIPIVHRDLKPENVFLARPKLADGRTVVKVLDFGIAKIVGEGTGATRAMGTPLWMAPEQTQAGAAVSPATDVWALGLVAFRLLTGRLYWRSANEPSPQAAALLREIVLDPLVSASSRAESLGAAPPPVGFDAWFARAACRDPAGRFANATDAWASLAPALGVPPPPASAARPSALATTLGERTLAGASSPPREASAALGPGSSVPLEAVSRTLSEPRRSSGARLGPGPAGRAARVASGAALVALGVGVALVAGRPPSAPAAGGTAAASVPVASAASAAASLVASAASAVSAAAPLDGGPPRAPANPTASGLASIPRGSIAPSARPVAAPPSAPSPSAPSPSAPPRSSAPARPDYL